MNEEALLLSLKSWPEQDPSAKALSTIIPLIQRQRGSFKDVNESLLEEEIAAAKAAATASESETSLVKAEDLLSNDTSTQQLNPREALMKKRQELIRLVGYVKHNCTLYLSSS